MIKIKLECKKNNNTQEQYYNISNSQIKMFALHVACSGLISSNIYGHLNNAKIDLWAKNQKKVLSSNLKKMYICKRLIFRTYKGLM